MRQATLGQNFHRLSLSCVCSCLLLISFGPPISTVLALGVLHQRAQKSVPMVGDSGFHRLVVVASARFLHCEVTICLLCNYCNTWFVRLPEDGVGASCFVSLSLVSVSHTCCLLLRPQWWSCVPAVTQSGASCWRRTDTGWPAETTLSSTSSSSTALPTVTLRPPSLARLGGQEGARKSQQWELCQHIWLP